MASSQKSKHVIRIGSSKYPVEGSSGNWSADGLHAWTLDGLHEKLSRRARQRVEKRGKELSKAGDPYPKKKAWWDI